MNAKQGGSEYDKNVKLPNNYEKMTSLDLGPAFTKIADTRMISIICH